MRKINKLLSRFYKGDNHLKVLDNRYLPRWIVLVIDSMLIIVSMLIVYTILSGTPIKFYEKVSLLTQGAAVLFVNIISFYIFKTYAGIIRHSTITDIFKLAIASVSTASVVIFFNYSYFFFTGEKIFLTVAILLFMLTSFSIMMLFRITIKEIYQVLINQTAGRLKKRVMIYGSDSHSLNIGKTLISDDTTDFKLIGFLNEKFKTKGGKLYGKPLLTIKNNFSSIIEDYKINGIIIADKSYSIKEKNKIVELCLENNLEVFSVPSLEQVNTKEGMKLQIKPIEIEDLLERDPIQINNELIKHDLENKTILVTGGAGSIGSEIVRQLSCFKPKLLVILDQAESALHELELVLKEKKPNLNFIIELADISNVFRLENVFVKHKIDFIYHAAAYKHVPMIEKNPREAVLVNILGTINLANLSLKFGIDKFVMISTDKAVNPTNVMGASKRAAEMYVQSFFNEHSDGTKFITTRFGNVLGSNGSVIPHFRNQISKGGPVTVTHKDIIRYFMTIPEACQLVLQAGTMGHGGEIFVFDMGDQVRILDLAEKMIRLSGFEPYADIDIQITGLRPGEKLYEELLNDTSKSLPTHHKKIMISKVPVVEFDDLKYKMDNIIISANKDSDKEIVMLLKKIVPEFKSQNSVFEELDIQVKLP
ncbi:MAG: polysaccharide biosynthesis protein [Flavobacteriaceae bacterium]|nr:polysaccharide biosynthesis protein [Flavobacteriaceae bacterium]